ncbi:MAG: alpha-L-fucosidase [Planctomycetota bacterium]
MCKSLGARRLLLVVVALILNGLLAGAASSLMAAPREETKAERDQRMAWWREARFGMFIHWGLYAVPAGVWNGKEIPGIGEWIMFQAQIPVAEYEPLAKQFNPVAFSAKEWVSIAKSAGMKYIVITSKHHDGFCLFDSKLTNYDIIDATPFKRDVLKELSEECRRQGILMCWYHSILDWHHPDYLPRGEGSPRPWDTRPTEGANYNRYLDYMKGQLRELLTNYGPIGVLWFDGGWEHSADEHRAEEIVAMLHELQPGIIINNRTNLPQDYDTPEQYIPATGIPDRDWETCMTMNDTWGYKKSDENWKSAEDLLRKLVDIVSKGGNFLLNVGPTAEGRIPAPSVERLQAMGRWLEVNGESIYGTSASPFRRLRFGRCTSKPGKLYLHVFSWPAGELEVPGLQNEVKRAYLLARPVAPLGVTRREGGVRVALPAAAPDPIDSVVVLEIDGEPVVDNAIHEEPGGSLELVAMDASIHGTTARYESGEGRDNIGYWTSADDWVSWDIRVRAAGEFRVEVTSACAPGTGGSRFEVSVGPARLEGVVEDTGSWTTFVTRELGSVRLPGAGAYTLEVKPISIPHGALMNLKGVMLRRVSR